MVRARARARALAHPARPPATTPSTRTPSAHPPTLSAQITSLDIDDSGTCFASAGLDRLVKLFDFDAGTVLATGAGHAGAVRCVRIAPGGTTLASVGDDGAIFLWRMPAAAAVAAAAQA